MAVPLLDKAVSHEDRHGFNVASMLGVVAVPRFTTINPFVLLLLEEISTISPESSDSRVLTYCHRNLSLSVSRTLFGTTDIMMVMRNTLDGTLVRVHLSSTSLLISSLSKRSPSFSPTASYSMVPSVLNSSEGSKYKIEVR